MDGQIPKIVCFIETTRRNAEHRDPGFTGGMVRLKKNLEAD
jgi:hypothetical protein